jgi:hypothetical protein
MAIRMISLSPEAPRGTSPLAAVYEQAQVTLKKATSIAEAVQFFGYGDGGDRVYMFIQDYDKWKKGQLIYANGKEYVDPKAAVAGRDSGVPYSQGEKRYYWKYTEGDDVTTPWDKHEYRYYEGKDYHEHDTEFFSPPRPPEREWYNIVVNTDGGWSYKPNTPMNFQLEDIYE